MDVKYSISKGEPQEYLDELQLKVKEKDKDIK